MLGKRMVRLLVVGVLVLGCGEGSVGTQEDEEGGDHVGTESDGRDLNPEIAGEADAVFEHDVPDDGSTVREGGGWEVFGQDIVGEMDTAVDCDDGNECTEDKWTEAGCVHEPLEGVECSDGDPCTQGDHCVHGVCEGAPVVCDDGNECTADECSQDGECVFVPITVPCDDGDPCTVGDLCQEGKCQGTKLACECHSDADCAQYEDGDVCNGTLVCNAQEIPFKCVVDPDTVIECPEAEGKDAICLRPACDSIEGKCYFEPDHEGYACDDGNACTVGEKCSSGVCGGGVATVCADDNPCTDDTCEPELGCLHIPNTGPCSDGNYCTVGDSCVDGTCQPGEAVSCDDGNVCTTDSCDPNQGCKHVPWDGECDDGNACTTGDHCLGGVCTATGLAICDDENPCTDDWCDPGAGCISVPNSDPCDDGDPCTSGDVCDGGQCIPGAETKCDDGNVCTDDECVQGQGCVYVPNNRECSDGNECTQGDVCEGGVCKSGEVVKCDDGNVCTDDWCHPLNGCTFTVNESPCDDGNLCTVKDRCKSGECVGTESLLCDDGNVCTDDSCDPLQGCVFKPNMAACDDGNACTVGDVCCGGMCKFTALQDCSDGNPCTADTCDPYVGCQHAALDGLACDDSNACTAADICSGGECIGNPIECDDGNVCTEDSCDPDTGCVFEIIGGSCDDGDPATIEDECVEGVCTGKPDLDEDGVPDTGYDGPCTGGASKQCNDNCPFDKNPEQADDDSDGVGSACDDCPDTPDPAQEDADGDGVGDACDLCPGGDDLIDSDGDKQPDGCEVGWAGEALPLNGTVVLKGNGLKVRLAVFKKGVTEASGKGLGIKITLLYKHSGELQSHEVPMSYGADKVNQDIYEAALEPDKLEAGKMLSVEFKVEDVTAAKLPPFAYNNGTIQDAKGHPTPLVYTVVDGICGNGLKEGNEECDDGNLNSGDGCSKACTTECTSCLYVAKTGSDENPGWKDAPLLTIQKAVDMAGGEKTTIIVDEGIYREKVTLKPNITIRGVDRNRVVIHGGAGRALEGGTATGFGTVIENVTITKDSWTYDSCTYFGQDISPLLRNCRIVDCGGDGLVGWRSSPRLYNSVVTGCDRGVMFIYQHGSGTCGGGAGTPSEIYNNVFVNCKTAVEAAGAHCSPIVVNNVIANCKTGLWEDTDKSCGWFEIKNSYNLFWENGANYAGSAKAGEGEFTADPLFVGGGDYHLRPGSPGINTGKPDVEDPDGSVSDRGHAGGPGAIIAPSIFAGFDFRGPLNDKVKIAALSEHPNGVQPVYHWTAKPYNPVQVTFSPNDAVEALTTYFESKAVGKYTFGATVSYGDTTSEEDTVVVTVAAPRVLNFPGDYPTIQAAVDDAVKGDKVLVGAGHFFEKVVLKDGVTLAGEGPDKTTIDGTWCEPAAVLAANDTLIENLRITGSPDMGYLVNMEGKSATLRRVLLTYTESWGTGVRAGGSGKQVIEFCTFGPAKWATHIFISGGQPIISHNIITGGYYGIYAYGGAKPILEYNDVWNNTEANYKGCSAGMNDLSMNPMFVGEGDFHLQPGSPCIDAGDPNKPDPDGSRPDLGAFPAQ